MGIVASLMLIHDLYPVPVEERVADALEEGAPLHGVAWRKRRARLPLEDGVVRLRLEGSCDGCPASSSTLELAIKTALDEAAPDLIGDRGRGPRAGLLESLLKVHRAHPLPMAGESGIANGGGEASRRPRARPGTS